MNNATVHIGAIIKKLPYGVIGALFGHTTTLIRGSAKRLGVKAAH